MARDDATLARRVEAHDFADTGRGQRALRDCARGEVLLEIPLERGFTLAAALEDDAVKRVASCCARHDDVVALHVCAERFRGEKATRAAHVATLPRSFDTAFFWSEEELRELTGTTCLRETMNLREETKNDYETLTKKMEAIGEGGWMREHEVDYERYAWARSNLWSRQCDLLMPDGKRTRAMVPTFDIFNHSAKAPLGKTHKLNAEKNCVTVYAADDYKAGEQAFISYGSGEAANSKLLTWYGFCIDDNPYEELDVTLTITVDKLRKTVLETALRASAVAYLQDIDARWRESGDYAEPYLPMLYQQLYTPSAEELEVEESTAEFIVKHTVPEREPLPPPLRMMARVQQLGDEELADPEVRKAIMTSANDKTGNTYISKANEMAALASLKLIFQDVCEGFTVGDAESDATELAKPFADVPYKRRLALLVRSGERRIATKAFAESSVRLDAVVRDVTRTAVTRKEGLCEDPKCVTCKSHGCRWLHELRKRRPKVEAMLPTVARYARQIEDALPVAAHIQTINLAYLWLMGHIEDDVANRAATNAQTWPFDTIPTCDASAYADLERMVDLEIDGSAGEEHPHNGKEGEMLLPGVYTCKVKQWGAWLLSQWATCGILDITDLNSIGAEAAALKRRHACSVPTSIALDFLAECAPLVEVGAGGGLWARRLAERGVDIIAYDTPTFDEEYQDGGAAKIGASKLTEVNWFDGIRKGGPESAAKHADRALLLSWIDIAGEGDYATATLDNYTGDTIITIGEWRGHTFGDYAPGTTATGMSFSREFQRELEAAFDRDETLPCANWPMFDSVLIRWRRRAPPS
jgi:hypothetical protein